MNCVRLSAAAILTVFGLAAQAPDLQFDVASLKPSQPGAEGVVFHSAPGHQRFVATNETLKEIIIVAYKIKFDQLSGAPGWIATDRFDINAEAERPSSPQEFQVMLRNLIKDRFKLRMHSETKERPVYVLSVDKGGLKMTPHEIAGADDFSIAESGFRKWTAKFVPMDYLAWLLSFYVGRPIIDRTGLKGSYDFTLSWTPDLSAGLPEGASADTSDPGIFEALQKQLGLRLEAQKGPVEILVIDHAEKPGDN
jgi:uncharacterized protein (TIGR03435 family)